MKLIKSVIASAILTCTQLAFAAPVEINKADAELIADSLKGIGEKKAEAIVAYRVNNGAYETADELINVKGIGKGILSRIRHDIIINGKKSAKASAATTGGSKKDAYKIVKDESDTKSNSKSKSLKINVDSEKSKKVKSSKTQANKDQVKVSKGKHTEKKAQLKVAKKQESKK